MTVGSFGGLTDLPWILLTWFNVWSSGSRPLFDVSCRKACHDPNTGPIVASSCPDQSSALAAKILGNPYDKKVPLPRIPNSHPLGSRHNTHVGQYCHTGNSALGQFCLSDNGSVGQFPQQYRDTPRTATSGPQRPTSSLQRSIAFLDTHTKIMSDFSLQQCTY
jgi:hypothetical protein